MKKYLLIILIFLLSISFVSAVSSLSVSPESITIIGPEDSSRQAIFTITNTGDTTLLNIIFNYDNVRLSDGTYTITLASTPTFPIPILPAGASQQITLTATIPDRIDMDVYSGTVNITTGTLLDSFNLDIIVSPEVCEEGPQGNLIVSIEDPESGEEFGPGDKIELSVNVENEGSEDSKVIVKALLYNMDKGKKIADVESAEEIIDEDDDKDFSLTLNIPTDTEYLKEENKYFLFVKAYEKGDEDSNCAEAYTDFELKLEDKKAVIESVTFSPSTATCGDTITAAVKVRNVGSENLDDVRVELNHPDLEINKVSEFFDLSDYGEEDDNEHIAQITFQIPEDAEDKEYEFLNIKVLYEGESSSVDELLSDDLPKLTISNCKETVTTTTTTIATQATLALTPVQTSVAVGSSLILNYVVTNPTDTTATYTLDFVPNGNWANAVSQTITVNAGQAYSGTLTTITNNVAQSTYSGTLYVKSGSNTLDQKTISIDLLNPNQITGGVTYTKKSLLDDLKIGNIPIAFWIISDLILAFIILALVYIVYRR